MCSRYFLDADGRIIAYTFQVPVHDRIRRRYNIAPTQLAPIVRAKAGAPREVELLRWGLVPFWAKDLAVGTRAINARSETAAEKPTFREAFKRRRCLVPASGFFEWTGVPGSKQPHALTVPGRELIAFAGLWESWRPPEGEAVETFTILTTEANAAVAPLHDRMPVVLEEAAYETWLHAPVDAALALLRPYAGPVATRAVNRLLGSSRHDVPELLDDA